MSKTILKFNQASLITKKRCLISVSNIRENLVRSREVDSCSILRPYCSSSKNFLLSRFGSVENSCDFYETAFVKLSLYITYLRT